MNEFRTYQTRLDLSSEQAALLDAYAALYGKAERSLFARLSAGESLSVLKREFIGGLGITARQFNALAAGVRGKIASVKKGRDRLIEFAKRRIKRAEEVLAEIPDKWKRHQKRRRIATLKARLANLESERDAGKMGIWRGEWRVSGGDCRVSSRSPRSYSRRIAAGWAIVSRRDRVALAARRRPGCPTTRSPAAPALASTARSVIPPPPAGAIPAREPSSALFGGRLGQLR